MRRSIAAIESRGKILCTYLKYNIFSVRISKALCALLEKKNDYFFVLIEDLYPFFSSYFLMKKKENFISGNVMSWNTLQ